MEPANLILFAIPVLLIVLMFGSQRKRQRAFADLQSRLEPGQEVRTTAGLYARLIEIDDTVAVLETAPGQRVRWDRRAIASVVPSTTAGTSPVKPGFDAAETETGAARTGTPQTGTAPDGRPADDKK